MVEEEHYANQPMARMRCGKVVEFLRRNYFKVCLSDGLEVIAAMPEDLLPEAMSIFDQRPGEYLGVEVRMNRPPRMHRIVKTSRSILSC